MTNRTRIQVEGDIPHVVIIGGGFAGLRAAKTLRTANCRVTLVDRHNHHLFQPLLYQVATAALSAPDIAAPIRKILKRQQNTTVLMAEVVGFDLERRRVLLDEGELSYDYLVVAAGMQTSYFGNEEQWEPRAPGLKTLDDALEIRRRVLSAFEAAELESDPKARDAWLNFVVVGAGPTGVELAGALAEIACRTLSRNFRNFDPADADVYLVEGLDEVLPTFPSERLRREAREELEDLGVHVRLGEMVSAVHDDCVVLKKGDGEGEEASEDGIPTHTVLWAAGVKASPLGEALGAELDRPGRVRVKPDLTLPGRPEVFVVGDMAHLEQEDGSLVPGLAPAALQMGEHAAINILRAMEEDAPKPFHYRDKGQMATIGRSRAVVKTGKLEFGGLLAWLTWLFIHILYLIGFRNRIAVILEWAWAYLTWQRGARIIVGDDAVDALPPAPPEAAAKPAE